MKYHPSLLAGLTLLLLSQAAHAFLIAPYKWPSPQTSMQGHFTTNDNDVPGGANWNSALTQAGNSWAAAGFTFTIGSQANEVADPCAIGGNQAVFHPNYCGTNFGASTLAVAATSYFGSGLVSQSDITFNSGKTWGVYSGGGAGWDFRRVAVHELGHVLGLDHSTNYAIMLPNIAGIEIPQADDVAGVANIYGLSVPNTAPNITSNPSRVMAENNAAVYTPLLVSDSEGGTMSFAISGGVDASKFIIGINSGNLDFVTAPDFEAPDDSGANHAYDVAITVTDNGGLTDSQAFTITILDVNENNTPPSIVSNPAHAIPENTTAVYLPISVSDAQGGTMQFNLSGNDATNFTLGTNSGNLAFLSPPDFENPSDNGANNGYNITVTVIDSGGLSDTQAFVISVTDVNENIADPAIITRLEEPSITNASTGIANLRGWAIGLETITKIELFVDGIYQHDLPSGSFRDDVAGIYPQYPNAILSGFSVAFPYTKLSPGNHLALIRAHDINGLTQDDSATFHVARLENPFISDPNTVKLDNATVSISGQDVVLANLEADNKNYNIRLRWRVATQQFEVEAVTLLGSASVSSPSTEKELTPPINTQRFPANAPINITLEEPSILFPSNGIANLRGWVIGLADIAKIELFIDNQYKFDIPANGFRDDVHDAFPQYPNSLFSGFSMAFAYYDLSAGTHTALVRAHDVNGLTQDDSTSFSVLRLSNAFIPSLSAVSLNAATSHIDGKKIIISNFLANNQSYTLELEWYTATQQFEIKNIITQ